MEKIISSPMISSDCTKRELIKFGYKCTIWLGKILANEEEKRLVWAFVKSVLDNDCFKGTLSPK